ncbi:hypothetical protein [Kineosporia sp. NBRC 101731]|uniref:hypothetical protein n=1 Tax=Kineosporia sp. NBRC 101731 TaxID=3032199 RepID=UPI0024A5252C|nr:hypothetical protein [Kineosporia sp. NBRC 101731]GLY27838.1 hypothetical protein Kisp02_12030 [Kineosporia sp. NBRC 101731]
MTARTGLIAAAITGLAAVLADSQTRCGRAADTAQTQTENALRAGWDGVAYGYETASEYLSDALSHLSDLEERLAHAVEVLDRVHDDMSAPEASGHLSAVTAELGEDHLDHAALAIDEALGHLETVEAGWLIGVAQDLARDLQESGEALVTIQDDVAEEIRTADSLSSTDTGTPPRIEELRRQGHGPQRHGPQVTDQQLTDRVLWWIDPMTGTTVDGDTGRSHRCGRHATRITSPEAFLKAASFLRAGRAFAGQQQENTLSGIEYIRVEAPLSEIFGPEYRRYVKGIRMNGTRARPTGDPPGSRPPTPTDFTDGVMFAYFRRGPGGEYRLKTMYPKPMDGS